MNGLRLALLASLFVGGTALAAPRMARVAVPMRGAHYALAVDGQEGGWAIGFDVQESVRPAGRAVRGGETVPEVTLSLGTELGESVRTWLSEAVSGTDAGHDVTVTEVDASRHPAGERSFGGSVRRKVRFPAMDASSKGPVHVELTFAPAMATPAPAGGTLLTGGRVDRQRRVAGRVAKVG